MALSDVLAQFTADAGDTVAHAAGTVNLTNQYDLGVAGRDIATGHPVFLVVVVTADILTGGAAGSIAFHLVSDSTAAIATDGTQSTHYKSAAFVTDDDPVIPAGTVLFNCALPVIDNYVSKSVAGVWVTTGSGAPYERYLGVQYVITTTTTTAGTVKAFLTHDQNFAYKPYAVAAH